MSLNTLTDDISFEGAHYTNYGFEYTPGGDGQITWAINQNPTWRILSSAMGPDETVDIGQRDVSNEPMAIIMVSFRLLCTTLLGQNELIPPTRRTWLSRRNSNFLNGAKFNFQELSVSSKSCVTLERNDVARLIAFARPTATFESTKKRINTTLVAIRRSTLLRTISTTTWIYTQSEYPLPVAA